MSRCTPVSTCSAGSYQVRAPTKQEDRMCDPCASGTYQPNPFSTSCINVTSCGSDWVVADATSSSDRECLGVTTCQNKDCQCHQPSCQQCFLQDTYDGMLLVRKHQTARTTPILTSSGRTCFSTKPKTTTSDLDYIQACRQSCVFTSKCHSFTVFSLDADASRRGQCCLSHG